MYIAIFDTGGGFLQWVGEAESVSDALLKLQNEIGSWIEDADEDEDSVHVYEVSAAQAALLDKWAEESSLGRDRPALDNDGQIYTVAEVSAMLACGQNRI